MEITDAPLFWIKKICHQKSDSQKEQLLKPRIFLLKHLRLDKLSWFFFQQDRSHREVILTNRGFHSEGLTFPPFLSELSNSHGFQILLLSLQFCGFRLHKKLKQLMSLQRPCSKVIERCSHPSLTPWKSS